MARNTSSRMSWLLAAALYIAGVHTASALAGPAFKSTEAYYYNHIRCAVDAVKGNFSKTQATYTVRGNCEVYQRDFNAGGSLPEVIDAFDWMAVGTYRSANFNAVETISVRRANSAQVTTPIIATFTASMSCKEDPWLEPDGLFFQACGSVRYQETGTLGSTAEDQDVQGYLYGASYFIPRSSMLSAQQRAALYQQYQNQLVSTPRRELPVTAKLLP